MVDKMIIDAKDTILGRLGSYVAKQALLGNTIDVINCEECVISGKGDSILELYTKKLHRKAPGKGPYFYRRPDMFVRKMIRGMLPFKRSRGKIAFKNVKCHIGVPENLKNEKVFKVGNANLDRIYSTDHLKVKDICKALGAK